MCNIAGYVGNKQAAPILLDMLRAQELYNGDMSTGIATIHEGKLHCRKIVGTVDDLIRETDVLNLPGTMGIAHTRPSGQKDLPAYQPVISTDETIALLTNGTTPRTKYCEKWDEAVDMLLENGYTFKIEWKGQGENGSMLYRDGGKRAFQPEVRMYLVDYYLKQGKTITEALALSCAHMYSDNVTVTINEQFPDQIFALRTSRPAVVATKDGESYLVSTRFGLPEDVQDIAFNLPLFYACSITRDGITVSKDRMDMEPVSDMTPYTYSEGYKRLEGMLKEKTMYFEELDIAFNKMRDLWPGDHTIVPNAQLAYDLLWQFDKEGRLKRELRTQPHPHGTRRRYYMWLED